MIVYLIALLAGVWAWQAESYEFAAGVVLGAALVTKVGYSLAVRENGLSMMSTGRKRLVKGKF